MSSPTPTSPEQRTQSNESRRSMDGPEVPSVAVPRNVNGRATQHAAPSKSQNAAGTNLYVGGLHDSVTDVDLMKRFQLFGSILSAKVMLHIHTGQSRGIGFVKFEDHESAAAAIQALHRSMFNGQRIMVRFADTRADFTPGDKTNKIFVRNLPFDIASAQLRRYFSQFGPVVECTLHLDTAGFKAGGTGVRTRMAYISFNTVEQAEHAAEVVHGTKPFPTCHATVMAKLAESDTKRMERRHRQREHDAKCSPFIEESTPRALESPSSGDTDAARESTPSSAYRANGSHTNGSRQSQTTDDKKHASSGGHPTSSSGSGSDKEKRESSESDELADAVSPTDPPMRGRHVTKISPKSQQPHSPSSVQQSTLATRESPDSPPAAPAVTATVSSPHVNPALTAAYALNSAALVPPPAMGVPLPLTLAPPVMPPVSAVPPPMPMSSLLYGAGLPMPLPTAYNPAYPPALVPPWGVAPTAPSYAPGAGLPTSMMPPVLYGGVSAMLPPVPPMQPSVSAMPPFYPGATVPMGAYPPSVPNMFTPSPYPTALPTGATGYTPYAPATTSAVAPGLNPYAAAGFYPY